MAHVSRRQRREPIEQLEGWVEMFGRWSLVFGLESPDKVLSRQWAAASAAWLIVAGADIYADTSWGHLDGKPTPLDDTVMKGKLWAKRLYSGATVEMRWDFWKERLQEIAGDESYDEFTREAVKEAEVAMRNLEC